MKTKTEAITLTLTRAEGVELRNQLLKAFGSMELCTTLRETPVAELFDLLSGNFENSHKGVHYL